MLVVFHLNSKETKREPKVETLPFSSETKYLGVTFSSKSKQIYDETTGFARGLDERVCLVYHGGVAWVSVRQSFSFYTGCRQARRQDFATGGVKNY